MQYSENFKKRLLTYFLVFVLIILLDQFSKALLLKIGLGNVKEFIPGFVQFKVAQNTGGAFSIFRNCPILFKIIGVVNVLIFSYLAFCPTVVLSNLTKIGCVCVLGGTVGNLIDRFFRGGVIDFLDFQFVSFAVFNLADVFIDLGVVLILIGWILSKKKN